MRRQMSHPELRALFEGIGEAVWCLQYAEDALSTYLTMKVEIKSAGAVTEAQGRELLVESRRKTFGQSLRKAQKHGLLPESLDKRLVALASERNWLVHRSMHEDGNSLYTPEGRAAIFSRLDSFIAEATALRKAIALEMEAFVRSLGLDVEAAEALARLNVARLRGDA